MATIESNTKIFNEKIERYQKLSLESMSNSIDLLKSIDNALAGFKNFAAGTSAAGTSAAGTSAAGTSAAGTSAAGTSAAGTSGIVKELTLKNVLIERYQKLSLESMSNSIDLLKSIDNALAGFKNFAAGTSAAGTSGIVKELTLKNILKDTLKLIVKTFTNLLIRMSKSTLGLIQKGFKSLYESNFVQFFKGLIVESYRSFTSPFKSLLKSSLSLAKKGATKVIGSVKNNFLKSDSGQFIKQKYDNFKEAVGTMLSPIKEYAAKGLKPAVVDGEKVSTLTSINETLEHTLEFWKKLVDKSDDPGSEDKKPSLLSRIFKKKDDTKSDKSSGGSNKAAKIGGKLGGLIGGFIGSALGNAITGFVMAFGNPLMFKAAAIFAATLPLIGLGIGGFIAAFGKIAQFGIDALSESLPKLSESLKTFESLDSDKLSRVGTGIGNFFKAFVGGALGGLLSKLTLPDPKDLESLGKSLKQFEGLNAQNITNSSVALGNILQSLEKASGFKFEQTDIEKLINLSKVLTSMDKNLNGDNLKKIGEGLKPIVDNTQNLGNIKYDVNKGGELGPLGQLGKDLSQFKDVNVDNIKNVGPAIASLGSAFADMKLGTLFQTISTAWSAWTGGKEKSLSNQLNEMATGLSSFDKIDTARIERIGPAIKSLGQGIKAAEEGFQIKEDGWFSGIKNLFASEDEGKQLLVKFNILSELGEEKISEKLINAGLALKKFSVGLQSIGNTNFDNVAKGLELIVEKLRPLITAMKKANFSPEETLQGVAEGMKMFQDITVPKESVAIETFLKSVGEGLKVWNFEESVTKTLTDLKNENILSHIAVNAPKFAKFGEISTTGIETNFKSLGVGLEELVDYINDGEIKTLNKLAKSDILNQLSKVFNKSDSTRKSPPKKESENKESENGATADLGKSDSTRKSPPQESSSQAPPAALPALQRGAGTPNLRRNLLGLRPLKQESENGATASGGDSPLKKNENSDETTETTETTTENHKATIYGMGKDFDPSDTKPPAWMRQLVADGQITKKFLNQKRLNDDRLGASSLMKVVDPTKMAIGQTVKMSSMPQAFQDSYRENVKRRLKNRATRSFAKISQRRLNKDTLTVTKTEKGYDFGVKPPTSKSQGQQNPNVVALGGATSVTGSYNTTTHNHFSKSNKADAVAGTR